MIALVLLHLQQKNKKQNKSICVKSNATNADSAENCFKLTQSHINPVTSCMLSLSIESYVCYCTTQFVKLRLVMSNWKTRKTHKIWYFILHSICIT